MFTSRWIGDWCEKPQVTSVQKRPAWRFAIDDVMLSYIHCRWASFFSSRAALPRGSVGSSAGCVLLVSHASQTRTFTPMRP